MGQRNNSRDGRLTFQRIGHLEKIQVEFSLEDMDMSGFQKGTTYEEIKAYMLEKYGLKVSSLYILQISGNVVLRLDGIIIYPRKKMPKYHSDRQKKKRR